MFGVKKKSIDDMTTEEIEKYLAKRKSSEEKEQSLKDRIDESVAEQEKADGDENEQDAKDRVDEALGEDEEIEEKDEEAEESEDEQDEDEEEDEIEEESVEETETDEDDWKKSIEEELAEIKALVMTFAKKPKEAEKTVSDRLSELERKYN